MGLLGLMFNMEYNTYMRAYDVPLSALLYVIYAGIPVYDLEGPTEEELEAYIAMLKRIEDGDL